MKITAIEKVGDCTFLRVTFSRDGKSASKNVRYRNRVHPDGTSYTPKENADCLRMELQRRAREADRDIAYELHGDDYRSHCELKSYFFDAMAAEEETPLLEEFIKAAAHLDHL